jgi:hypothetical protein
MTSSLLANPYASIIAAIFIGFLVLRRGHALLDFLRDLDDYRAHRPRR